MKEPVISYKDLRVGETYTVTRGRNFVDREILAVEESPFGKRGADNIRIRYTERFGTQLAMIVVYTPAGEVQSCTAKSFCKWFRRKSK